MFLISFETECITCLGRSSLSFSWMNNIFSYILLEFYGLKIELAMRINYSISKTLLTNSNHILSEMKEVVKLSSLGQGGIWTAMHLSLIVLTRETSWRLRIRHLSLFPIKVADHLFPSYLRQIRGNRSSYFWNTSSFSFHSFPLPIFPPFPAVL